jgi:hypothetical protein
VTTWPVADDVRAQVQAYAELVTEQRQALADILA